MQRGMKLDEGNESCSSEVVGENESADIMALVSILTLGIERSRKGVQWVCMYPSSMVESLIEPLPHSWRPRFDPDLVRCLCGVCAFWL